MTHLRPRSLIVTLISTILLILVLTPACAQVKEKAEAEKAEAMKPVIRGINLNWGDVTSATTEVTITVVAFNPNPFPLPVKKAAYQFVMAGIPLATGETVDLKIEKNTESPIKISAKIDNGKIPDFWAQHLKNQEKSVASIDLSITFDLLVTDFTFPYQFKIPIETNLLAGLEKLGPVTIEKTVEMPIIRTKQTVFKIALQSLSGKWGQISRESTELNLLATIHNQNPYPLVVPKIAYEVTMNDISLVSGETGANYLFAPNSKNEITTKLNLNTLLMNEWFVSHIKQGEKSTLKIKVALVFELPKNMAKTLGQDKIIIDVWETDTEFQTRIMPQSIKF